MLVAVEADNVPDKPMAPVKLRFKVEPFPLVKLPLPVSEVLTWINPVLVSTAGLVSVRVPTVKPPAPLWVKAAAVFIVRVVIVIAVVDVSAPLSVLIVAVPEMFTVPAVFVMPAVTIIAVLLPVKLPVPLSVTKPVSVLLPVLLSSWSVPLVIDVVVDTVKAAPAVMSVPPLIVKVPDIENAAAIVHETVPETTTLVTVNVVVVQVTVPEPLNFNVTYVCVPPLPLHVGLVPV